MPGATAWHAEVSTRGPPVNVHDGAVAADLVVISAAGGDRGMAEPAVTSAADLPAPIERRLQ